MVRGLIEKLEGAIEYDTNGGCWLWAGNAYIAERVMVLANCVGASVTRPEGFEAWVSADGALPRQEKPPAGSAVGTPTNQGEENDHG